jgi:ornithine carbamoyltransferase
MNKDLVSIKDLSKQDIEEIFALTSAMKKGDINSKPLEGKSIAMIFTKPSNRTRVSFEVGIFELGGYPVYLGPKEIRIGERETVEDAAKVMSRYIKGVVIRTFDHDDVVKFAKYADVPVINGLSDLFHPCQILADIFTIKEKIGLEGKKIVYVGDGNNIVHSWLYGAAKLGLHFVLSTPVEYKVNQDIFDDVLNIAKETGANIEYIEDPQEAVVGADVIYTDVWASMGKEKEEEAREKHFSAYKVDEKLVSKANKDYLFMHCLPAHRGKEVADEVIDGPNSVVCDEAENRLHVQKAILSLLIK